MIVGLVIGFIVLLALVGLFVRVSYGRWTGSRSQRSIVGSGAGGGVGNSSGNVNGSANVNSNGSSSKDNSKGNSVSNSNAPSQIGMGELSFGPRFEPGEPWYRPNDGRPPDLEQGVWNVEKTAAATVTVPMPPNVYDPNRGAKP